MKKLNLGCGEYKKEGYINLDYFTLSEPDIRHNLEIFPYPFNDNVFDLIEADHLLEHLHNPMGVMREIHRIAKNKALVIIKTPHFSRGFTNADHKRGFDVFFPYYFNPIFKAGYQGFTFRLKKVRLSWFAQGYMKKDYLPKHIFYTLSIMGKFIDFFANLWPSFCSRLWCFWVGGFEEIEYHFVVEK